MTTLPQPSSRYPTRPANGLQGTNGSGLRPLPTPALAQPAGGGPPEPQGMTGSDVMRVLRQNVLLILLCVALALGAGYGVYYYLNQNHQLYTARGQLAVDLGRVVDDATGIPLNHESRQMTLAIEQQSQVYLLQSDQLISNVLADPNSRLRETAFFRQFDGDAAAVKRAIREGLSIDPLRNTNLINVRFDAPTPDDAEIVVQELIAAHLNQQASRESSDFTRSYRATSEARSSLYAEQQQVERRISGIIGEMGDDASSSNRRSMAQTQRDAAISKLNESRDQLRQLEGVYENFQAAIARGETPSQVERLVEADSSVAALRQQMDDLDLAIKGFAARFGPRNRMVADAQVRRDNVFEKLENRRAEVEAVQRAQADAELASAVESARGGVDVVEQELEELNRRIRNLAAQQEELAMLRMQLERVERQVATADERIRVLQGVSRQSESSTISRHSPVEVSDGPTFPDRKMILAAALVIGLGLGLGVAFLREFMDTSVRSPRDVGKVGQMTLLGMVPHAADDPGSDDVAVEHAIARAPTGIIADQFRQIRGRLNHAAPPETARTLLVTSAGPGDGKTTVASNLAAALALSGRRVLLVDANFRRGKLAAEYKLPDSVGFGEALAGGDFGAAVHESELPNLAVMPAGAMPEHATETVEGGAFERFCGRALEDFDQVIFDGAPVMLASETAAMAPRVDGVVSVARASANSRGLLGRLRDTLRQLHAEHVGVVLNGVRAQAGGYYKKNMATYYDYSNPAKRPGARPALKVEKA